MIVKLLIEHHLKCLSLKGCCIGSSESTHVKMPHCWKSHALAHYLIAFTFAWSTIRCKTLRVKSEVHPPYRPCEC